MGYYASIYDNKAESLRWDNPFNSPVPGGTEGRMALEPGNDYQEIAFTAGMHGLPWNTVLAFSAAIGRGHRRTPHFLPYTINPSVATDAAADVESRRQRQGQSRRPHGQHASDRPVARCAVRSPGTSARTTASRRDFTSIVHTDLFPVGEDRVNPIYGYERLRLSGTADFDVYNDLTVGLGGEYRTLDRKGTPQEVIEREDDRRLGPRAVSPERLPRLRA